MNLHEELGGGVKCTLCGSMTLPCKCPYLQNVQYPSSHLRREMELKEQLRAFADENKALREQLQRYEIRDRLGNVITDGCVVHWTDGGDDLPLEKRIATRWDRIAVTRISADTTFTVIDSPSEKVKDGAHTFHMGNFIYKDTHNHLTVVANSAADYSAKFKNAGECMAWVLDALAEQQMRGSK